MLKKDLPNQGEMVLSPEEIAVAVAELARRIDQDYADKEVMIVGLLRGVFILLADLVLEMEIAPEIDFLTVRSYGKSTVTSGNVEVVCDLQDSIEGKHVIVVDDIIDTGHTIAFLDPILRARGPASIEYCMLLDKPERRMENFDIEVKYIGRQVPNKFLYGYGLDGGDLVRRNVNGVWTLGSE